MRKQNLSAARILAQYGICRFERFQSTQGDILQVSDRCGNNVEHISKVYKKSRTRVRIKVNIFLTISNCYFVKY